MYKMVLVDDDIHVLRGFERKIDWTSLDVDIVGTASDGSEALSLIKKLKPEIVMTDIQMPIMDGIELTKEIDAMGGLGIKVVILSGFGEFDYAKQAIKYNAVDYLLKPTSTGEIVEMIKKLTSVLNKESKTRDSFKKGQSMILKNDIIEGIIRRDPFCQLFDLFSDYWPNCKLGDYIVSAFINDPPNTEITEAIVESLLQYNKEIKPIIIRWDEHHWLILLSYDSSLAHDQIHKNAVWFAAGIRDMLVKLNVNQCRLSLGGQVCHGTGGLYTSIDTGIEVLKFRSIFKKGGRVIDASKRMDTDFSILIEIQKEIEKGIDQKSETILQSMKLFLGGEVGHLKTYSKPLFDYVVASCFKWMQMIRLYQGAEHIMSSEIDLWEEIIGSPDLEALENYCLGQYKCVNKEMKVYLETTYSTPPVQYVLAYVDQHYGQNIYLKELSKTLSFSENYLTTLFKKRNGCLF